MGPGSHGIDSSTIESVCAQVAEIAGMGVRVGVVVGAGNIFRGLSSSARGMDRVTADQMGMLATVINSLALVDTLNRIGAPATVLSAVAVESFVERYSVAAARRYLDEGRIVVLAAGTGNPFFTTDTAASLRAMELDAGLMVKATNVDGVFSADPRRDPKARFMPRLTFREMLEKQLGVMDATAVSLLEQVDLPLRVVNLNVAGNLKRAVTGEEVGTLITKDK